MQKACILQHTKIFSIFGLIILISKHILCHSLILKEPLEILLLILSLKLAPIFSETPSPTSES